MRLLLSSLLVHVIATSVAPSPWWVPDLTLVGLILAITRRPVHWLMLSGVAGLWTASWAIRFPVPMLLGAVLLGWVVHLLVMQWDLTDLRVQSLIVGAASLLGTLGGLWLEARWSLALLVLVMAHALITGCAVPCIRSLLDRGVRPRSEVII